MMVFSPATPGMMPLTPPLNPAKKCGSMNPVTMRTSASTAWRLMSAGVPSLVAPNWTSASGFSGSWFNTRYFRTTSGVNIFSSSARVLARLTRLVPQPLQRLRTIVDKRIPPSQENTLHGSRENVRAHYDLSNDLFEAFLDPTMSYSAAWFDEGESVVTATRLEEAQLRKIDGVLDFAGV